jgi:Yip1 domain
VSATAERAGGERGLQRTWWLRAVAVLVAPRAVFAAIRDDSDEAAEARQEPVAAVAGLAGIAGVLATPVARHLLNEPGTDSVVVPVWAFVGGAFYALALYWLFGACLWAAGRGLGSLGSYRRARHVLALSAAPLALSLLTLWPVRILVYGVDLFRTGGNDYGRGDAVFGGVLLGFFAWAVLLLVVGVRSVHGWTWLRALATVALAALFPALIVVATRL